ncbi:MAG TPA: lysylphosphatidylglycerol synthase transmembrane domain-containing protein [Mycobacteriales bacterium]|nr:lysylphosphatidylglycerol synthase transmembrane domain-containing protein [Mycobacteriales bacterium]
MTSPATRRIVPPGLRLLGGGAVLVAVLVTLGGAPFGRGLHAITLPVVAFALAITGLTTLCSAWRWCLVARGLGVELPLSVAIPAYYRSQFLNSVLPGGIVGDVQRAVAHGRRSGDLGRGLRAVAWERLSGQCVQVILAVLVLLAFPSPVRPVMPFVLAGMLVLLAVLAVIGPRLRLLRAAAADIRAGVLTRWTGIFAASTVVTAGHGAVFVVAARTVGSPASYTQLIALAMLAQLAMSVPLALGGWGPREGVTAWAFAAAGLGAASGVAVTTGYGVLALIATLPGAAFLVRDLIGRAPVVVHG